MRVGFKKVMALKGGLTAWLKAGYPVEPEEAKEKALQDLQEMGEI